MENIVGKEKMLVNSIFPLFSQCFQRFSFSGLLKVELCDKELNLAQTTNFRLFKVKEFADNNFGLDETGGEFQKEKGEIAHYEPVSLFPQCFQKTCIADT